MTPKIVATAEPTKPLSDCIVVSLRLPGITVGMGNEPDAFTLTMPVADRIPECQYQLDVLTDIVSRELDLTPSEHGMLGGELETVLLKWELMDRLKKTLKVVSVK